MSQSKQDGLSKEPSSRYHLPDWFLERNVKTSADLEGSVPICQCKACENYKKLYEDEETEVETPASESTSEDPKAEDHKAEDPKAEDPKPEEDSHTSSEKHDHDCEDAISYAKFSELRDMVATNMLWRHMRPQDSSVLFRRCTVPDCSTCLMEPVHMGDIVSQVAKSLGMGMLSLSFEDLEELGSDFHVQDKGNAVTRVEQKTTEKESPEETKKTSSTTETSTTETSTEEGKTTEASSDKNTENNTKGKSDEATTPKEPIKDEWKPNWSDPTTFTDHFFAARSKKWVDESNFSYSAWRDRTKESYAAILDGASVKIGQKSRPQDEPQAENSVASTSRGLLIHFIDCDDSWASMDYRFKRRILVRLGELVQEKREKGQDVVLVLSSRTLEPGEKLCNKAGVATVSSVTLSIVNPSEKNSKDRDFRWKGAIYTRRLRRIMETGIAQSATARPDIKWLQSATGDEIARYGQKDWSFNEIQSAAGQILAKTWIKPRPVITSKHVDSVLRRLGMLASSKSAEKNDEKEKSGETETKSDEVVEETEQDPLENIALDGYEEKFRECVIKSKDLKVSWDDVILDQDTKEVIQNLVPSSKLEVEASSEFLLSQLRIRGCLLYGPPGTGKTQLCRAIASSSGSRMLSIDNATTQSMWVGESEKAIHAAFSLAAKLHPCVLFIDEADALFYRRTSNNTSWERSATTQFLVEMEGLAQNPNAPLVVVATNRPWDLDEAFLRRLPQKFCIGLPDRDSRAAILRLFLKDGDLDPAVDVDGIADATKGFSGSDLRSLCAESALVWKIEQVKLDALCGAVSPAFGTARRGPKRLRLDVDHFAAAFEKMQPNKARDTADELERFERRYNPTQGGLGRGSGGKRYVFNDASGRNEALSVRELISRPAPPEGELSANMQLVVWRSAEEVLFPGKAGTKASEAPSLSVVTTSTKEQSSEETPAASAEDERSKDLENDSTEPKAQSVDVAPCSEFDTEKAHSAPDHQDLRIPDTPSTACESIDDREEPESTGLDDQDLCTPDTPSTACEVASGREGDETTGQDLSRSGLLGPELPKMKTGADVDLVPLLVTLAAVFWYS
ncbi:hypothetical protein SLS63_012897 [Diaporthe eres]|uniref:AAA+ ATPase domain-containing protein n=1 Tax=Diaporthe eres TaxID=83184 RepID=A0ABR1NQ34_DIAER